MVHSKTLVLVYLIAGALSQFATFEQSDFGISVNVPSSTASGKTDQIFFQINAPRGTQWLGFGQGGGMAGANMFIIYTAPNKNVTLSPRLGTGHVEPQFNADARLTLLEGSGVQSDGSIIANVRCDTCLSWNGGQSTMDPKDPASVWIWAHKNGSPVESPSSSADISFHDAFGHIGLDLTKGTGGESSNPFMQDSSNNGGVSSPVNGDDSASSSSSSTSDESSLRRSHAITMSIVFLILFPLAALTICLPYTKRVRNIHAPLQLVGLVLSIIGGALGIVLARRIDATKMHHPMLGYCTVVVLIVFQPAMRLYQHLHFRKHQSRSLFGVAHCWLGRSAVLLGAVNGVLGFQEATFGTTDAPEGGYLAYSVVFGLILVLYVVVVLAVWLRARRQAPNE